MPATVINPRFLFDQKFDPSFRASSAARTLDFGWLHSLTEEDAYDLMKAVRFSANAGNPFCPVCGCTRAHPVRDGFWECGDRACRKWYSVTSGTAFHSRKISYLRLVRLVCDLAVCAKGTSAVELSLKLQVSHRTAWMNCHKIREVMAESRDPVMLRGAVEVDAAWFGGAGRKPNMVADRKKIDRRKKEHQLQKRALIVARQRLGRTLIFATSQEDAPTAIRVVRALIDQPETAVLYTDGSPAYSALDAMVEHKVVDHAVGFMVDGIATNEAESSFSRPRRAHFGNYHKWSPTYLDLYAAEMSWRDNYRRTDMRTHLMAILHRVLASPVSPNFKGYCQYHQIPKDEKPEKRAELRWWRIHDPDHPPEKKEAVEPRGRHDPLSPAAEAALSLKTHRKSPAKPRPRPEGKVSPAWPPVPHRLQPKATNSRSPR